MHDSIQNSVLIIGLDPSRLLRRLVKVATTLHTNEASRPLRGHDPQGEEQSPALDYELRHDTRPLVVTQWGEGG